MYKAFGQPGRLCVTPILLSFSGVQPHCRKKKTLQTTLGKSSLNIILGSNKFFFGLL
jgi:hypothetical protein